jgi:L-alanine-DL-glutamate epimerase-like enolase superfamily enzyme
LPRAALARHGIAFGRALDPYGLYFFEEPCWPESLDGLAAINAAITTPVATGERITDLAYFQKLFAIRGCDVCQLDITHCGGLTAARRIAALADAHRIALAPHNPQGPVSTAASLEFGFSQPGYIICETVHGDVPWRNDVVEEGFTVEPQRPDRAAEHASGFGDRHQRRRSPQTSVPAGTGCSESSIPTAAWEIGKHPKVSRSNFIFRRNDACFADRLRSPKNEI